jgi:hypothetical protein
VVGSKMIHIPRVDEIDKIKSREIKLIFVAFVYACVKTQNFAFCDLKKSIGKTSV